MSNSIGLDVRALTNDEILAVSGGTTAHGLGEGGGTGTGTGTGNLGEFVRGVVVGVGGALSSVLNTIIHII
jgi:hypothetical protein